ncbi:MAG: serine/threonine protein kinase, partial [Myxococcales bacterium]|nr:serine/threonine protein kinase [Myxococcales bacterium]
LKRLHRTLISSPEALARLKREFEALARLRHPALVAVRDVIRWEGDPTLVMDFIEGRDLDRVLAEDGPLAPEAAEALARTLFEALGTAHGAGIVHRDVKPQNVRVGPDGQVYLLDFGSARLDAASQLTETGTSVGTPDYMAPELFSGAAYDPRVDIYGVGATLFKVLT